MMITLALIQPHVEEKILDLAYKASKKIDLTKARDEIYQGGQLVKLLRVAKDNDTLMSFEEKMSVLQGLISIGNLTI